MNIQNNHQRVILFLVILMTFLFATPSSAKENVLKVGTDTNYVPFEFLDEETGEYIGFDIDLLDAIAKEVGFEYELKPMDFAGIVPSLQTQQLDMAIAGISMNEEKEKTVDFSLPYYDAGTGVLVRNDEEEIHEVDDLVGKVVATKQGTASYEYVMNIEGTEDVVPFPNIDQAYMELLKGSADAVVFDSPSLIYYMNTNAQGKVRMLDELLEGQTFGIAFPKGSPLKIKVDEALTTLKENGTYDELHEKWFGEEFTDSLEESSSGLDWSFAIKALPLLLQGAKYTILITVLGLIFGLIIGITFGFGRLSKNKLIYGLSSIYVEVVRGTPIMIQALYIYFAIPMLLNFEIDAVVAGVIAISINAGAYIAEIVRGGIHGVDKGQVEAGRSLGLTQTQTMVKIIWPQAFKQMIPPLGNQFIISLKDTSLLTMIGVGELTRQGTIIVASNFRSVEIYTVVGLMYLAMTLTISLILRQIEKRMDIK